MYEMFQSIAHFVDFVGIIIGSISALRMAQPWFDGCWTMLHQKKPSSLQDDSPQASTIPSIRLNCSF
jgi:hypothetical protein